MRTSTVIGISSLALNAVLLALVAIGSSDSAPSAKPVATAVREADQTPKPDSGDAWSEIEAAVLADQPARLSAEGFPPSAIRAILAAQIREKYSARRKSAEAATLSLPFWKQRVDPVMQAELRAIYREEQKELTALLGPDPVNGAAARLSRQFPHLSADKVEQLTGIRERYDEQRQALYTSGPGSLTLGEREKMNALDKAMNAEFAAVLTPTEWEDYTLRTSNTANSIRYSLNTFEPSEAEFRTIFNLRKAFEENHAFVSSSSPDQMRVRMEAQKQLDAELASTLGPARYADYQRSNDHNYQQTSRLVARLGLPAETANELYRVQKEMEGKRNALYTGSRTNPAAITEQLPLMQQEATARIATVLGGNTSVIAAYKEFGGSWLSSLAPRPPPSSDSPGTIRSTTP